MGFKEEIEAQYGSVLNYVIKQGLKEVLDTQASFLNGVGDFFSSQFILPGVVTWEDFCNDLVTGGYIDQSTADTLKQLKKEAPFAGFIVMLAVKIMLYIKNFTSVLDVFSADRQYNLLAQATPNPAPAEALVSSMMIDPSRASENRAQMKRLGYNDTQIDNIILSAYRRVDEGTIRTNYLRGHYTTELLYERMRELGYTDTRTAEIVKTWQLYPAPADLFTMVAHEAFEPDIYTKIGLDAEFPSEQIPWLEAQGISKEWAMKYWISHWNQPSLEMGFEMLHRGVIDRPTLDMLFRIVEIPQFWRDKLMAITYNPYTRVDVRRMHELGVVTTAELVQAYQDLGYDGAKAVKMAEFTIRFNAEGDNKLTRGAILTSYHEDLISRTDALDMLTSQNLSDDAADYYLTLEDYKIAQESVKLYTDTAKERYLLGIDSEAETRSALNKLGLRGSKTDALLDNWTMDKYKYEQLPSKSDIDAMLIGKVITEGQWKTVMNRYGYSPQHQSWYLKLMNRQLNISVARPTKADLQGWYKKELISVTEFRSEMAQLGYSEMYINLYLQSM